MIEYVVDACTAVKLYLPEAHMAKAQALFGLLVPDPPTAEFHVPDLFYSECANIFWKHVRRGTCTPAEAELFNASLHAVRLQRIPTFDLVLDALPVALTHGISAYDACYVVLADRLRIRLITADQKLEQKLAGTPLAPIWLGNWVPPP